jgi:hypothetical protein
MTELLVPFMNYWINRIDANRETIYPRVPSGYGRSKYEADLSVSVEYFISRAMG